MSKRGSKIFFFFLSAIPSVCIGSPEGFQLISGSASAPIQNGNDWTLTSGKQTIVEWNQFNLALQERFFFEQADSQSAILNRVVGKNPCEIFGQIHSNGKVILINQNGILIGSHGRIETAGFTASTFDLSNENFLQNNDLFEPNGNGIITHLGTVECPTGKVNFIGRQVTNEGGIRAPQVLIHTELGDLIEQSEDLDLSPYQQAICHHGLIEAEEVILWAEDAALEITGSIYSPGGKVHVLGDDLSLLDDARIDVSAPLGGGVILIGGDYQGKNPSIPNSESVWVGSDVALKADALESGDGGKVIVWSNENTSFYGKISAKGGFYSGNGGFAEISSPEILHLHEFKTDLSAANGKSGLLLLDPTDITIGASATTGTFTTCGSYSIAAGATNQILNTDLQNQLANCSVTITTVGSGGAGPNGGSITVSSSVTWAAPNTLTLNAASHIVISAAITPTSGTYGPGIDAIIMNAKINAASTTSSSIRVAANLDTTSGNGGISLTGDATGVVFSGLTSNGILIVSPAIIKTSSGNITLLGIGGTSDSSFSEGIQFAGSLSNTYMQTATGAITLNGTGASASTSGVSGNIGVAIDGNPGINITGAGSLSITGNCSSTAGSGGGHLGVFIGGRIAASNVTGSINISGTGATGGSVGNGNVGVYLGNRAGGVGGTAPLISSGAATLTITGTGGSGTSSFGVQTTISTSTLVATTGSININSTLGNNNLGANITTAGGPVTFTGNNVLATAVSIDTTNSGGFAAGSNITFTGATSTINGTAAGSQALTLRAGTSGAVTFGGAVGGTTRLGAITITSAKTTANAVNIGANISANSFSMSTASPTTLTGTSTIDTSANNGVITFGSTIDATLAGTQGLTLTSGSGVITLPAAIGTGTSLANFSATSSTGITLNANITTSGSSTGAISFPGAGGITLATGAIGITAGTSISFNPAINGNRALTLTAGTSVTLTSTVGNSTAISSLTASGTSISLGGNITTAGGLVSITGPTTLASSITIDATNAGGSATGANITFSGSTSTINGTVAGSQTLSILAGTSGAVTFGGAVGGTTRLGAITITNAKTTVNAVNIAANISANSFTLTTASPVTITGNSTIDTSVNNGVISFNSVTAASATIDGAFNLALTSGSGVITLPAGPIGGTTPLGSFAATSSSTITTNNNITTAGGNITFTGPVSLGVSTILDTTGTGATGADISFSTTLNAASAGSQALTLLGGSTGSVTFSGVVGGTNRIGAITITSAKTTINAVNIGANISANSFTLTTASPVTLTGNAIIDTSVNNGVISFNSVTSASSTINGAFNLALTSGSGVITLPAGPIGGTTPLASFAATSSSPIVVNNNITTAGGNITFIGPVSLGGSSILDTTGSSATGAVISFSSTLNAASVGSQTLTLLAGSTGSVTFSGVVGGTNRLGAITITSAKTTINAVNIGANISANSFTLTTASPVTITGNSTIDTSANNGVISFNSVSAGSALINGAFNLALTSGSGVITLPAGPIGGTTPLGSFAATSSSPIVVNNNITTAGGDITFTGPVSLGVSTTLDTTGTGATGAAISFSSTLNAASAGSQTLTILAGSTGSVTFSGVVGETNRLGPIAITSAKTTANAVNIGANISANSFIISSSSPATITGDSTINTSIANGNIFFPSTVNGTQNLTLNAGNGIARLGSTVGNTTPLASLSVTAGSILFGGNITTNAGTISITGPVTLTNSVTLDTTNGGALSGGANINFGGSTNVDAFTSGVEALTLQAGSSGSVTFGGSSGSSARLGGLNITSAKTSSNAVNLGGNITSNSFIITTASPVQLSSSVTIDTSGAGGNISFPSTIDGAANLSLNSGIGTTTLNSTIGGTTPLSSLSVTATTINLMGNQYTTGLVQYLGPVILTGITSITNSGSGGISFNSTITGPYSLSLIGSSTSISVSGVVALSGTAVGQSGGNLTAFAGGDITFFDDIQTTGGLATGAVGPPGGSVLMQTTGGSITVQTINTSGTNDLILGGAGGNISLQPAASLTAGSLGNIPNGRIILAGDLNASGGTGATNGAGGTIDLATTGRSSYPSIATIISSFSGNSVTIQGRSLNIGSNESMTIFGSITATLTNSATVYDMTALDALTITAPSLTLIGHGAVQILNSSGSLYSIEGGHLFARTTISAPVTSTSGQISSIGLIGIPDQATLQSTLTYLPDSYILNYGLPITIPTITVAASPISREQLVYQLGVASSSFESMLPMHSIWKFWPYFGKISPTPDFTKIYFESFLRENEVVKEERCKAALHQVP